MKIAQTLDFYSEARNQNLPGVPEGVSTAEDRGFFAYFGQVLSGAMILAAILLLIYLLWGGIEWITSGGDSSKLQKARDKMTQAIIGLFVFMAAFAIFGLVQTMLGIEVITLPGGSGGSAVETTTPRRAAPPFGLEPV